MSFTLKQFTIGVFLLLLTGFYFLFNSYYNEQQNKTAKVVLQNLESDVANFSYVLSKYIRRDSILTSRSLLDSESANNHYVAAVVVFDNDKLLVTSDPAYTKMLPSEFLHEENGEDAIYHLLFHSGVFDTINYYVGKVRKEYTVVYFLDHQNLELLFNSFRDDFLLVFLFVPLVIVVFLWILINRVILIPLERLRQYAYYQSEIPKKIATKEMEYIRASMVQTFHRLEVERKELYDLSRTDALSGLANRNLLQERTTQIIEECKRNHKEFAIIFLDLDHFKSVNDSLGHDVGDELIKQVALKIQELLRVNDVVARIGGDEFVIAVTHYHDEMELIDILDRIRQCVENPWLIYTYPIHISCSMGVTIYPHDGNNLITLMKNADIAMYEAKDNGRGQYRFYTKELNDQTQKYISLSSSMKDALDANEYELFYQPQNDVQNGKIIGAEALIRWKSPTKGMISPAVFVSIAEQNGFIVELGSWVLREAIKQKSRWEEEGVHIKLSINVAAKQIVNNNFIPLLSSLIQQYKVTSSEIALEITEYIFLENNENLLQTFDEIKRLGLEISLDDFGTGYSSLAYLKSFPIDTVKIDKAFIDDSHSEDGAIFVETIVKMAETLRLKVVAEGVEQENQIAFLKELGCDYYQGYVCSKPVEIKRFNELYYERVN
jgi:diguanylate cyclase